MAFSHSTIVAVANDGDLQQRFIAAAAAIGIESPEGWVTVNRWKIAAYDQEPNGLLEAYAYAMDTDPNEYKKWGKDPGVINDVQITEVIQAVWDEQNSEPEGSL